MQNRARGDRRIFKSQFCDLKIANSPAGATKLRPQHLRICKYFTNLLCDAIFAAQILQICKFFSRTLCAKNHSKITHCSEIFKKFQSSNLRNFWINFNKLHCATANFVGRWISQCNLNSKTALCAGILNSSAKNRHRFWFKICNATANFNWPWFCIANFEKTMFLKLTWGKANGLTPR